MKLLTIILLIWGNILGELKDFKMSDRQKQVKTFLRNISNVESSGGTNFNHPEVQSGLQEGDRAIGRYGLMPNTVYETINRMRLNGTATPEVMKLNELDPENLKATLESNPNLEDQLAESLANRVLDRQGDEGKAAYSWHQGHNLTPEQVEQNGYQDNPYVKKFNDYKQINQGDDNE